MIIRIFINNLGGFFLEDDKNVKFDNELFKFYQEENDENSFFSLLFKKRRRFSGDSEEDFLKSFVKKFRKLYMSFSKVQFFDFLKDVDQEVCDQFLFKV